MDHDTIAHVITLTRRLAGGARPAACDRRPMHRLLLALQDTGGWLVAAAALYAAILLALWLGRGG